MLNRRFRTAAAVVFAAAIAAVLFMLARPGSTIPAGFEPQVLGAPRLAVLSEEIVDHGDVIVNRFVETEFVVQNVGDEMLVIMGNPRIEVVEGCCPPETTVGNRALRSGEMTTIRTRFTMHPGMDGPHEFWVHVVTNDPEEPNKILKIFSNWII